MVEKVISGGQTGADQAALITAAALGIATGGWAAQGWKTEDGPAPWLEEYGLRECARPGYPARTEMNVRDSSGTLIITHEPWPKITGGTYMTACVCESLEKPCAFALINIRNVINCGNAGYKLVFPSGSRMTLQQWMAIHSIRVLNVAGPRESKSPGIFERAGEVLMELLGGE